MSQNESLLQLEVHLRTLRGSRSYLAVGVARYILFFLPSIAGILAVIYLKSRFQQPWSAIEWTLLAIDAALVCTCIGLVGWLARSAFFRITE